ncbi:MAG TPA: sugar ABC transporter permease [Clostridiales bacterium]|nr:sugar ABC transporter permease [Clostridiales bacterium]
MTKTRDLTGTSKGYRMLSVSILVVLVLFFLFPLYWIITGSFKDRIEITARQPIWFPLSPTVENYTKLFDNPAFLWLFNIIFISFAAMVLTCITASLAGYALGKKRFIGRGVLFTIIICAMALPKQVIVIPLAQEMTLFFHLNDTLWAVILPTVGWPFGVFLMKQFSENIPSEILEAARVDGAGELRTFTSVVFPMIKPGIGALAIFTFVNTWNDYFLQLVMLTSDTQWTLPLAIANMQGEMSTDYGLIMAGAALASVPIITVFVAFQKYFTQGIAMGAVKG